VDSGGFVAAKNFPNTGHTLPRTGKVRNHGSFLPVRQTRDEGHGRFLRGAARAARDADEMRLERSKRLEAEIKVRLRRGPRRKEFKGKQ
jgi:hypothetical protein